MSGMDNVAIEVSRLIGKNGAFVYGLHSLQNLQTRASEFEEIKPDNAHPDTTSDGK